MEWVLLGSSLLVILGGAELFTNGVEWIGEGFGLSEGVVGSVLAAVGTALPETILPLVAILSGHAGGEEIGIGAILGAPFMLTTLAMFVVGTAVLVFARGGRRSTDLDARPGRAATGPRVLPVHVRAGGRRRARARQGPALRPRGRVGRRLRLLRATPPPGARGARARGRGAQRDPSAVPLGMAPAGATVARPMVGRVAGLADVRADGHLAPADRRRREDVRVGGRTRSPRTSACPISSSRCWSRPSPPSSPRSSTACCGSGAARTPWRSAT